MSAYEWLLGILSVLGVGGGLTAVITKRVRPVVTMADLLTEVQEERDGLRSQRDAAVAAVEAVRAQGQQAVVEVQAEAARAIEAVRRERDQTIADLRTQNRVLLAENSELRDYAHVLRRQITDGEPPPPRPWPEELPA